MLTTILVLIAIVGTAYVVWRFKAKAQAEAAAVEAKVVGISSKLK